tara:strand:- start:1896 stop:3551 length:1656 start_codon:yes stop_codon:yes gene_type:complete
MANYNYVSPAKFVSYADLAKQESARLMEIAKLGQANQNQSINKRREKTISQIEGLQMDGWATAHKIQGRKLKAQALNEINSNPDADFNIIATSLLEIWDKGNSHAEVGKKDGEYQSYIENPDLYDGGSSPYGMEAVFNVDGLNKRRNRFNNVGLVNYDEDLDIGQFRNPEYDPNDPDSPETLKQLAINQGKTVLSEASGVHAGKEYYVTDSGEKQYVSGGAFDSSDLGNLGIFNPDFAAAADILPSDAHLSFKTKRGAGHFTKLATNLNRQVDSGEKSFDQARKAYVDDALEYIKPDGLYSVSAFESSALALWERDTETDYTTDENISPAIREQYGTPWEYYANKMADGADLFDPEKGTGSDIKLTSTERRQLRQLKSKKTTEPSREFVREIQDPQYDWESALINAETESERKAIQDIVVKDPVTNKFELKPDFEFGSGVEVRTGNKDVTYKGVYTNQVEIFEDAGDNGLVVIYTAGKVMEGEDKYNAGFDTPFAEMASNVPFVVINMFKPDDGTDPNADPEFTEEYEELINSFDALPIRNALQTKIASAQ